MISREIARQIADELGYSGRPIQFKSIGSIGDIVSGNLFIGYWTISSSVAGSSLTLYLQGNILNVLYCPVDSSGYGATAQWFGVTDDVWSPTIVGGSIVTFIGWVVTK